MCNFANVEIVFLSIQNNTSINILSIHLNGSSSIIRSINYFISIINVNSNKIIYLNNLYLYNY